MKDNKYILEIDDLNFGYSKKRLFHHFDLKITANKITTIIGCNGCGKSTLFQLMTGYIKPESGLIRFQGRQLNSYRLKDLAKVMAIVQQSNTAPDDITVEKLVSYGRIPFHSIGKGMDEEDQNIINHAIEITGIKEIKDSRINELSGGQRQRVFIAMAIAQNTDVILLDEPTTYLDIRYQMEILDLVKKLNREYGITIIMVLHDINQACAFSDEIIALGKNRKLIAQGEPNQIITSKLLEDVYGVSLNVTDYNGKKLVITA